MLAVNGRKGVAVVIRIDINVHHSFIPQDKTTQLEGTELSWLLDILGSASILSSEKQFEIIH